MSLARFGLSLLLMAAGTGLACAAGSDLAVIGKIAGPDAGWDYASINQATRQLYVGRTDGVMTVDLDTGKLTEAFVPGAGVHGVIVLGDSGIGVSANGKSKLAILFDTKSGKILASIPTGDDPDAAAYDPATGDAVIMEGDAHQALVIDPKAMKAVGTIDLGAKPEFAASDGKGHLFVNMVDTHELVYADIASLKVTRRTPLVGCENPSGLAYDAADDLVISTCRNGVAVVSDGKTGAGRANIPIGQGPDAAMFDPEHKMFYVPCGRSGTLAVIAVKSPTDISLAETVPTALGARTGAFDAKTGKFYFPTAQYQLPVEPGKRPQTVPGTFIVLIVGRQ